MLSSSIFWRATAQNGKAAASHAARAPCSRPHAPHWPRCCDGRRRCRPSPARHLATLARVDAELITHFHCGPAPRRPPLRSRASPGSCMITFLCLLSFFSALQEDTTSRSSGFSTLSSSLSHALSTGSSSTAAAPPSSMAAADGDALYGHSIYRQQPPQAPSPRQNGAAQPPSGPSPAASVYLAMGSRGSSEGGRPVSAATASIAGASSAFAESLLGTVATVVDLCSRSLSAPFASCRRVHGAGGRQCAVTPRADRLRRKQRVLLSRDGRFSPQWGVRLFRFHRPPRFMASRRPQIHRGG